jgi:hypothetical protein
MEVPDRDYARHYLTHLNYFGSVPTGGLSRLTMLHRASGPTPILMTW